MAQTTSGYKVDHEVAKELGHSTSRLLPFVIDAQLALDALIFDVSLCDWRKAIISYLQNPSGLSLS